MTITVDSAGVATLPRPKKSVKRALQLLAYRRDHDEIAQYLAKRGFIGYRSEAHECPVANYLRAECGANSVTAGNRSVACYFDDGIRKEADTPYSVRLFISNFDAGYYPQLDARELSR